jgi:hypothetical protein
MKCRGCRLELVLATRLVGGVECLLWVPSIRPSNVFCFVDTQSLLQRRPQVFPFHYPRDKDIREDLLRLATD